MNCSTDSRGSTRRARFRKCYAHPIPARFRLRHLGQVRLIELPAPGRRGGIRREPRNGQFAEVVNRPPWSAASRRRGMVQRIFPTNFRVEKAHPSVIAQAVVRVRPEPPSGGWSPKRSPFSLQGARREGKPKQAEKHAGSSGMPTSCRSTAALRGGFTATEADERRPVRITAFRSCSARPR